MRVMVTGAFGTLGRAVGAQLAGRGYRVSAFDVRTGANRKAASRAGYPLRVFWGDIRDDAAIVDAVAASGAEAVVHLAAILAPEPRRSIRVPLQRGRVLKLVWPSARSCKRGLFRDGRFDYRVYKARRGYLTLTVDDMKGWLTECYMNCRTQQVYNPATGEVQATVALASEAELRAAVESAKAAQPQGTNADFFTGPDSRESGPEQA